MMDESAAQNVTMLQEVVRYCILRYAVEVLTLKFLVHELTEKCWDKCMDRPSTRLESRTESCIKNCVERFIDSSNFVANRLQKVSSSSGHM
ncbi:mitochondrial import inner membrane translocase subunit Tim8 A-like [Macrobrachium nipponense]|uniref:mitochondrial import inner membrane translocase subunit Tim8 A-like n=1 Tax=Macrobrachium nipponense TaxID=159736 RepID=UPI0030C87206